MKTLPLVLILGLILYLLIQPSDNRYIMYSNGKAIHAQYLDTRDTIEDGRFKWFDLEHEYHYTNIHSIDSVMILKENKWTAGPKSEHVKYINRCMN